MKSVLCVLEPVFPLDPGGSFRRSMFCHGCTLGLSGFSKYSSAYELVFFAAADPAGGYKGTRLLCFDQALTVINWEMQWSEGIKVSVKEREFTISDRSGKGKFADVLGDASRWKEEVESFGGGLRPDSPAKMSRPGGMTRGTPDKAPRPMGDLRSCAPTSMPNLLEGLPMMCVGPRQRAARQNAEAPAGPAPAIPTMGLPGG